MKNKTSAVIFVFNDKEQLALQLRAAHDESYPHHWDFSAAGGIDEEENHEQAAQRELEEEIGVTGELSYIQDYEYKDEKGIDHLYIYKTTHSGPFTPQEEEVDKVEFFSIDQIQEMIDNDEKFHPEFKKLWELGLIK